MTLPIASFQQKLLDPLMQMFTDMYQSIIKMVPNLMLGIVTILIGYFAASTIRKILSKFLEKVRFDGLLERAGISSVLNKTGFSGSPSKLLSKLIFWIILLFIFKSAANHLGMQDITKVIDGVMAFLPKLFVASIILLAGFMVADLVQNAAFRALDSMGLDYAKMLASLLFGFIFVLVLTVALSQLGIETELLNASVKILLGSLALGLAICLGLGLKGLANQVVSGVYARDIYSVGTKIQYEGEEMTVAGVGPVTTKLTREEGEFMIVPNHFLVSTMIKGKSTEE